MYIDPAESRLKRMKKNVLNSIRLHLADQEGAKPGWYLDQDMNRKHATKWRCAMVTLTYRNNDDYDKRDISECLKRIRQYMKRRKIPFRYVWVMELQKRGAPHYHVITWLPWGMKLPKVDAQGWWTKGHSNMKFIRKPWYVAKYASKTATAGKSWSAAWSFPKGARISGQGGLSATGKLDRRWWCAPLWVRKRWTSPEADVRPCPGGGWYSRKAYREPPERGGGLIESPYLCIFDSGRLRVVQVGPIPC